MAERVQASVPLIYNLFPRLIGTVQQWPEHTARATEMGFNWVYINPIHYVGYSGSLYAVSDFYRVNPDFLPEGHEGDGLDLLKASLKQMNDQGIWPMMDLVINHTAMDSPLVREHPEWFHRDPQGKVVSPFAIDPADDSNVTVWGDLAEIDNEGSPDRETLWNYWAEIVRTYLNLGFRGFRCDAAYKVPADLWRFLVGVAREADADAIFFAETLGCRIEEVMALKAAGLHYLFNSSKWWDFEAPWALEQHAQYGQVAPSISFPETHDTPRLAAESNGSEAVQRQRYAFAATFSAGLMMPIAYEYGFRKSLHVVEMTPDDWEEPAFDLTGFIRRVNETKLNAPVLQGEGHLRRLSPPGYPVLILERYSERAPGQVARILVNRSTDHSAGVAFGQFFDPGTGRLVRLSRENAPAGGEPAGQGASLDPGEVALILPASPPGA